MEEEEEVTAGGGSTGRDRGKAPPGRSAEQAYREIGYRGIAAARELLRSIPAPVIPELDHDDQQEGSKWVESET